MVDLQEASCHLHLADTCSGAGDDGDETLEVEHLPARNGLLCHGERAEAEDAS